MARKHNTKHAERSTSHYKERLTKRGYRGETQPHMESVETLRARQARRESPWSASPGDDQGSE